jgi:hypothetical protein
MSPPRCFLEIKAQETLFLDSFKKVQQKAHFSFLINNKARYVDQNVFNKIITFTDNFINVAIKITGYIGKF